MNVALADPTSPHGIRLTVRDFLLLQEHGAFEAYSKSELIEGEIVCVNSQFARHSGAKSDLAFAMTQAVRALGLAMRVYVEVAVELDEHNLLEPDIVLSTYRGEGLVPAGMAVLVVEVSDTTLRHDLVRKAARYAAAGIPEYWVVDLKGRELHQLWSPAGESYGERRTAPLGEVVDAITIAGLSVATAGV